MFVLNGKTLTPSEEFEWSLDGSNTEASIVKTRCVDATPEQLIAGGVTVEADPAPEAQIESIPPRIRVTKTTIISRLNDLGLLQAASQVLNADLYTRERWYAPDAPFVYADAPEALALLAAIGADPAVILAAEA